MNAYLVSIVASVALFVAMFGFTVAGAYARFDARRQLIVDEANAIGTAYLRLDLLSSESQAKFRPLFREYVTSRYELWLKLTDRQAALDEYGRSLDLQNRIWSESVAASVATTRIRPVCYCCQR